MLTNGFKGMRHGGCERILMNAFRHEGRVGVSPEKGIEDRHRRQLALARYDVLDSAPEAEFDAIVEAAAAACGMPLALINLIDKDRQWAKAVAGDGPKQLPLCDSICALAIEHDEGFEISDTTQDARVADNPLVTGEAHLRFYAGVPLRTAEGIAIGTLCVADDKPGRLTDAQRLILRTLAQQVMTTLELRRMLRQHRRSDHRSKAILESAIDYAIIAMDLTGHVTSWNVGAERILGWTAAEMCGQPAHVFFTDEDTRDGIPEREMGQALLHGRGNDERWHQRKDGGRFYALGEMMPLKDEDGVPEGFIKILRDRTEQRLAEEKQRADAEFMRGVLASSADCIKVLDLDAKLTFMSEGGQRVMEVSDFNAIRGCPWPDFWTGQGNRDAQAAIAAAKAGGVGHFQGTASTMAGNPRYWDVQVTPIFDAHGKPEKLLSVSRDITAQRLDAEALKAAALRLQRAQEAGGVGVFSVTIADDILHPTPEFCRLYGVPVRDSYPTAEIEALLLPEDRMLVSSQASRSSGNARRDVEYRIRRPDTGEMRWIARNGAIVSGEDGRPIRFDGVARDITEQRAGQEALRASEERLNLAFDAAGAVGWWDWDIPNDRIVASELFARLYSVDPVEAAAGTPIARYIDGIHPDDRDWVSAKIQIALGSAGTFAEEYRLRQSDGSIRWVYARGRCYHDEAGKPIRYPGVSIDITARKTAALRQAALARLGDRLRDLSDTAAIIAVATTILGESLELTQAGYGAIDLSSETIEIAPGWRATDVPAIAGLHRFRDYGSFVDQLKRGETVLICDVTCDPRTADQAAAFVALGTRALANHPIMEHGRFVATFFALKAQPHDWADDEVAFIRDVADRTRAAIARIEAEDRQRTLNLELSHRMKNMLAMVQSIATQTMRGAGDLDTARDVLANRLIALGRSHDLLLGGDLSRAPLSSLIENVLDIHRDHPDRIVLDGPVVPIGPRAALSLSLMLHELATNAAKYGALSNANGQVTITWRIDGDGAEAPVTLRWSEAGGPLVVPPQRTGFGTRLIGRGLAGSFEGVVDLAYPATGVVCTIVAPLRGLTAGEAT